LRQPQVDPNFVIFFPLAAAASRPKTRLATAGPSQVGVLVELQHPQIGKKIENLFLPKFGRDPVAHGSSATAPSPPRAHAAARPRRRKRRKNTLFVKIGGSSNKNASIGRAGCRGGIFGLFGRVSDAEKRGE